MGLHSTSWGWVTALALTLPPSAHALPVLNEILYDGPGSDPEHVFTEIAGIPGFDLAGWRLDGVNGANGLVYRSISLDGLRIPDDGLLLLATASATGEVLAARDFVAAVDWQNGPDAVRLLDALGTVVDALQYGDAGSFNAGEGTPALLATPGTSLSRNRFASDSDDNAIDFMVSTPTPGYGYTAATTAVASAAIGEPPSAYLFSLSLLAFAIARRR